MVKERGGEEGEEGERKEGGKEREADVECAPENTGNSRCESAIFTLSSPHLHWFEGQEKVNAFSSSP